MAKKKSKAKKKSSKKKSGTEKKPKINLSDAERIAIGYVLSESNAYRRAMRKDPVAALARLGIEVKRKQLPKKIAVPRKAKIRRSLGKYLETFKTPEAGTGAFVIRWPVPCDIP
ncbi:MAG: hypothetical protein HKN49_09825 [Gammaproteobacteria bacterium]|nr:hypothetical protein [Gammaproteobacteria bacterium]